MSGALPGWLAAYYDGVSAERRPVRLSVLEGVLVITTLPEPEEPALVPLCWPLEAVRRLPDTGRAAPMILRQGADDPARLVIEDRAAAAWAMAVCPALDRPEHAPGDTRRLIAWAAVSAAIFTLLLFVLIPRLADRLAPLIPAETEARMGAQIRVKAAELMAPGQPERFCTDPAGLAALGAMSARLTGGETLPFPLVLSVLDSGDVNAFAAPGGQIVVLRGLIEKARSADEVAAVLAHEIGHVAARDPTRAALRAGGTAGLAGLVFGDAIGAGAAAAVTARLIDAGYSRSAETAADAYAAGHLDRADVPPSVLADFFDRLSAEGASPRGLQIFLGHPGLAERSAALRRPASGTDAHPILTNAEWEALRNVCRRRSATP